MVETSITETLKDMAFRSGADFIGMIDPSCFENSEYTGNKPQDVMTDLQSVIILGVSIPRGAFDTLPNGRAEYQYFAKNLFSMSSLHSFTSDTPPLA
ncbi:hypothetical protein [Methanosarcina siciliae]|uniref:hypothetical protein n=1 Tax=Methanosarcina siciliae TaxID=38027 RepID=UPI00064E8FBA|nr:hypothetical protein [Methanosarcina siciliae]